MSDRAVTLRQPRTCNMCGNKIQKGETAIYFRYPIYRENFDGQIRKHGEESRWMHPYDLLCYIDETHRQDCIEGKHEMIEHEEIDSSDFFGPGIKTGKMVCKHCGYSLQDDFKGGQGE